MLSCFLANTPCWETTGLLRLIEQRKQARLTVTLGGAAFAGRSMIFAHFEQGRLFRPWLHLGAAQGHQFAPEIAMAVDGAGQGRA